MQYTDEYVYLGDTGLQVSRLAFGCGFRGVYEKKDAIAAICYAMDSGINFFDCANTYRLRSGIHAETALGEAMRGKREQFIITSKVGSPLDENNRTANDSGASRMHMMRAVEDSLKRLQTDYIDIYLLHLPDAYTGYEELLRGFDQLRRDGKIRYAGLCNHKAWQIGTICEISKRLNTTPISVIQNPYNLLNRSAEEDLLPACAYEKLGVMTYSPLAAGLLSGAFAQGKHIPEKSTWCYDPYYAEYLQIVFPGRISAIVDAVNAMGEKYGVSSATIAAAWILKNKSITSIVTGVDTPAEFDDFMRAQTLTLLDEDREQLDDMSEDMHEVFIHGVVQSKVERYKHGNI